MLISGNEYLGDFLTTTVFTLQKSMHTENI